MLSRPTVVRTAISCITISKNIQFYKRQTMHDVKIPHAPWRVWFVYQRRSRPLVYWLLKWIWILMCCEQIYGLYMKFVFMLMVAAKISVLFRILWLVTRRYVTDISPKPVGRAIFEIWRAHDYLTNINFRFRQIHVFHLNPVQGFLRFSVTSYSQRHQFHNKIFSIHI